MKILAIPFTGLLFAAAGFPISHAGTAEGILKSTRLEGGAIVVLGCGDPDLLTGLGAGEAFLVQGLDADPDRVAAARQAIESAGLYGRVSATGFDGKRLPYAGDLVNLVVADGECLVPREEIRRILAPGGIAWIAGEQWEKAVPEQLDDWTHYLHGPGNNAVSKDAVVGPVGSLKWQCGPLWSRSHEFTSSLSILVSAGGRIFYILDEGIVSVTTPEIPEQWAMVARDAYNGKQLWRMPLPQWRSRLGDNTALRSVPPTAQRCLVAGADKVYVSSLLGAPIAVLDAATGKLLRIYENTAGTREFVKLDDSILLYREDDDGRGQGRICRLDLASGELQWSSPEERYKGESLGASEKYVVFHTGRDLVCLDCGSGRELWRAGKEAVAGKPGRPSREQATCIVHEESILECEATRLTARRAATGEILWQTDTGPGRAMRGSDSFVARGCVWHASGDRIVGYDLATGKPARTVDPTDVQSDGHHLRCYRAKATENFLITQYRGVEFIGIGGQENVQTDWARGACSFGVTPANGLLYVPPNPCFCYPGVKVRGLNALAPRNPNPEPEEPLAQRLTRGPAYGRALEEAAPAAGDPWPTYRQNPARHGSVPEAGPARPAIRWKTDLGGQISPPVMAGGKVFVAVKDRHAVCAMDAENGEPVWQYVAGARVDSPPTIHRGLALFGSADGFVHCVTADRGELVWKFRAAPAERRIVVFDQFENSWPVHGSVLVNDGRVYCAAGRSSMLDGGIWLFALDPATGEALFQTNVDTLTRTREDAKDKPPIPSYAMEGTHADILVCEGDAIYMGPASFDLELNLQPARYAMETDESTVALDLSQAEYIVLDPDLQESGYEEFRSFHRYQEKAWPEMSEQYQARFGGWNLGDLETGLHIAPTAGFLDDSWFNRTYWMYSKRWPGWYHAHRGAKTGQLLAVGKEKTYAVQAYPDRNRQSPLFFPGTQGYLLTADANDNEPVLDFKTRGATKGLGYTRMEPPLWHEWTPIRVRAMVEAGDTLYAAGTPDEVPEEDPTAALEGRRGALLRAFSAASGEILAGLDLEAPPVFDGLIAAGGRLFLSTENGEVVCFAENAAEADAHERADLARLQTEQSARREKIAAQARNRVFGGEKKQND